MHEIDFTTGRPAIAYTGKKPWHGFGEPMNEDIPLEEWRVAAGLNWNVQKRFLRYREDPNDLKNEKTFPNRIALIRSDNKAPLAVVSNRFKVVQPEQIIEFFRSIIKENGFKMSTAGALKGGKRVWAMADCGKEFSLSAVDRVGAHLLLATAYDGTFATTAQFTSIRVVCNNTLGFSLDRGSEGGIVKIPHTQEFNSWDVKAELGFDSSWNNFKENIFMLSAHKVTKREAIEYFMTVLGVTETEAADGKQLSNVKKLIELYESGPGSKLPSSQNTLWGALNAVTFLTDHCRAAKNTGNRFDSASFGGGAILKREAFKEAVSIAA